MSAQPMMNHFSIGAVEISILMRQKIRERSQITPIGGERIVCRIALSAHHLDKVVNPVIIF